MSRSIDHFNGEPSVVMSLWANSTVAGREAGGRGDGAALIVQREHRLASSRRREDVADAGPYQAGDAGAEAELSELFPHVVHDRIAKARVEAGVADRCFDRVDALRRATRDFAKDQIVKRNEVGHITLGIETGADICDAAQYMPAPNFAVSWSI
jgi:hypothetical protein